MRLVSLLLLCWLAGCRSGPECPPGTPVEDPALATSLRTVAQQRLPVAFKARFRGLLECQAGDVGFTALVRFAPQARRLLGLSDFGATLFEVRYERGAAAQLLKNTTGLPDPILLDGLYRDLSLALLAQPDRDATLHQREGHWLLREPDEREFVYDQAGSALVGVAEADAGFCLRHLRLSLDAGQLNGVWSEHFALRYKARLVLLELHEEGS